MAQRTHLNLFDLKTYYDKEEGFTLIKKLVDFKVLLK